MHRLPSTVARIVSVALPLLFATLPLAAQPTREELLAEPRHADTDLRPAYKTVPAKELEQALAVRSAVREDDYGERQQTIDISLPKGDNGLHTIALVGIPEVRDAKGAPIEASGFRTSLDPETGVLRIHYLGDSADAARVATVKGHATVRYPLRVTTHSIKAGDKGTWAKYAIEIDGPYIRFDDTRMRAQRWGGPQTLIRAYDASGRQLEHAGEWSDDEERMFIGAYGKVARVDFDVPEELAAARIEYELDLQKPDAAPKVTVRRLATLPLSLLGDTVTLDEHHLLGYLESFSGTADEQLFEAIRQDDPKAVRYLLALGADPNTQGKSGISPFGSAAMMKHYEVATLLLEAGADVRSKDDTGVPPLLRVVPNCPPASFVEAMIAKGADPKAEGHNGMTAVVLAKVIKCDAVLAVLQKAGAK